MIAPQWHNLGSCLVWLVSFHAFLDYWESTHRSTHLGMFSLLTFQAATAILHRRCVLQVGVQWWLLGYICITFVLAMVGFAANIRYTEMIWIDLHNALGGPAALIWDELSYWINLMAMAWYVWGRCGYFHCLQLSPATTSWCGSCMLSWYACWILMVCMAKVDTRNQLHWCFIIFGREKYVVIPMGVIFLAMFGRCQTACGC